MLLKFIDRKGQPCAIVKEKIVAMCLRPDKENEVNVYVDGSDDPFAVQCTMQEAFQIYDGAWLAPKSYGPPQEPIFQYQQNLHTIDVEAEHKMRLNSLEKFQRDMCALYPEAMVFVKTWDGGWSYNTKTSAVDVVPGGLAWQAHFAVPVTPAASQDEQGWVTVEHEVVTAWVKELEWLHFAASKFYGPASTYYLQASA